MKLIAVSTTNSASIPGEELGPPGIPGVLHIGANVENDNRTVEEKHNDRSTRPFKIKAALAKEVPSAARITGRLDPDSGNSYLLAHSGVTTIKTRGGDFVIHHNAEGELSLIEFDCVANSSAHAKHLFYSQACPVLDSLSYQANVPIHFSQVLCHDETNQELVIDYVGPHPMVPVNPGRSQFAPEMFPLYALYREAKNAASPFYKFLCYYKILEGVYEHLRAETFKKAENQGIAIKRHKELFPRLDTDHPEIKNLIGRPIKYIFDKRFKPDFRNKIAHFLDEQAPLNVSDFLTSARFAGELLLIESCVRVVLDVQADYFLQLRTNAVRQQDNDNLT